MEVVVLIVSVLFLLYAGIMLFYRHWFIRLKPYVAQPNISPKTAFTIIIPARNEAMNIGELLQSIYQQNYPKHLWEVIVIDDYSTDNTVEVVKDFMLVCPNIHVVELAKTLQGQKLNAYKKKAIETGIALAKHEWILTTDADCLAPKDWLITFDVYIQTFDPVFVGGPVAFSNDGSLLQTFQCIDFMALQGITAAAVSAGVHAMSNGANLGYKKSVFKEVNGFKGIDNIASGDDMLLMNKIKQAYPKRMGYVFSPKSIIVTKPMETVSGFLNQRIRWASKTNKYKEAGVIVVLWLVLIFNIALLLLPFFGIFHIELVLFWLLLLLLKTLVEASFAVRIAAFFSIKLQWQNVFLQIPHIIYTSLAGCFSLLGSYQWKDRKVQ